MTTCIPIKWRQDGQNLRDVSKVSPDWYQVEALPSGDSKAQCADSMQEFCSMLQKRGHLGVLVHWALHWEEAAMKLVDQTYVHHIAGCREKRMC